MARVDIEIGKRGKVRGHMTFEDRFITKVRQQLHSRGVGFLFGAGTSYLDGADYPLAANLWDAVKPALLPTDQDMIQTQRCWPC